MDTVKVRLTIYDYSYKGVIYHPREELVVECDVADWLLDNGYAKIVEETEPIKKTEKQDVIDKSKSNSKLMGD